MKLCFPPKPAFDCSHYTMHICAKKKSSRLSFGTRNSGIYVSANSRFRKLENVRVDLVRRKDKYCIKPCSVMEAPNFQHPASETNSK